MMANLNVSNVTIPFLSYRTTLLDLPKSTAEVNSNFQVLTRLRLVAGCGNLSSCVGRCRSASFSYSIVQWVALEFTFYFPLSSTSTTSGHLETLCGKAEIRVRATPRRPGKSGEPEMLGRRSCRGCEGFCGPMLTPWLLITVIWRHLSPLALINIYFCA